MNADLHRFVRDALSRGLTPEQVRAALTAARWPADEIEAELAAWHDAGLGLPVPRRRVGVSPREAFLHLLMFVALYLTAYHTGAVMFAWVERWFVDVAFVGDRMADLRAFIRFSLASLVVAFPVYLVTARIIGRAVARDPEKRTSGVRRWLTWLTLFVAACVLIGDLIAVLLRLFEGEVSARFLGKTAVVALIAGWIFTHYLGQLRRDEADVPVAAPPQAALFARVAGLAVLLVTLSGLWVMGTPARARRQALDRVRLQSLERISEDVLFYRNSYAILPTTIEDVTRNSRRLNSADVRDPVTRAPYRYRALDEGSFELCATFDAPDSTGPYGGPAVDFWRHGAGEACFTFRVPVTPKTALPPAP